MRSVGAGGERGRGGSEPTAGFVLLLNVGLTRIVLLRVFSTARHLRGFRRPLYTCRLASRWKEDMAFLRSSYVADDIWRFA